MNLPALVRAGGFYSDVRWNSVVGLVENQCVPPQGISTVILTAERDHLDFVALHFMAEVVAQKPLPSVRQR